MTLYRGATVPVGFRDEIDAIAQDVRACQRCVVAGCAVAANPISPSALERRPKILLIGQAPGPVTDRKGYHFAGPAGRVLDQWFQRAGFAPGAFRAQMYLTSLTRCFPGKAASGSGDRPPSRQEMALCGPFLQREIAVVQPHLTILVGKMAADAFVGKMPLTESVGRVHDVDGRRYLPLPHASGVSRWLNDPAHQQMLDAALAVLARLRVELRLDEPA